MEKTDKAVTGEGNVPSVTIRFESVSGKSLQSRFKTLAKYYSSGAYATYPAQWVAEEFKKSLIANIERGVVVVEVNGERGLA